MPYFLLAQKTYRRFLQYRAGHMINNVASAIFGFVYIAVWQATSVPTTGGVYSRAGMAAWVAFNQALLWLTTFHSPGLEIPGAVRSGAVSVELIRPVHYFLYVMSKGVGEVAYNVLFRALPLFACFALTTGVYRPTRPITYVYLTGSLLAGIYVGLCLEYLQGACAFWTYEIRWVRQLWFSLQSAFSGFFVPVDFLPGPLSALARVLPFAALNDLPARIYLEYEGAAALVPSLVWALALTGACLGVTAAARRRVEVQGG